MTTSYDEKIGQIVAHAYANAPAVKKIFDEAGVAPTDVQGVADLEKIPITSKDELAELQAENPPFGGFLAVSLDTLRHVFLSPGPLYEPSAEEGAVMDTVRDVLAIAGFAVGDVVLNTFGYHLIPTGLAIDQVLTQMGTTVIPAGVGNADLQIKMMRDLGVTSYVGTPSWLMKLIGSVEESNLDFSQFLRGDYILRIKLYSSSLDQEIIKEVAIRIL